MPVGGQRMCQRRPTLKIFSGGHMKTWVTVLGCLLFSTVISAVPVEEPLDKYAALAFSRSRERLGKAYAEDSAFMAKESAMRGCIYSDCEVKMEVRRGCIGIASGYENPGPGHVQPHPGLRWYGWGAMPYVRKLGIDTPEKLRAELNRVRSSAQTLAINACEKAAHSRCQAIDAFCTWDAGSTGPDVQQEIVKYIERMGGENSQRVRNVLYLIRVASQGYLIGLGLTYRQVSCLSQPMSFLSDAAIECELSIRQLRALDVEANK